ncbi:RNA-directed DNA polymerase, eukaryota, partial [Tanacetum coccineum]
PLVVDSSPALVLDESCVVDRGLWVMIELDSIKSKEKFLHHDGVASWFKSLRLKKVKMTCLLENVFALRQNRRTTSLISLRLSLKEEFLWLELRNCSCGLRLSKLTMNPIPYLMFDPLKIADEDTGDVNKNASSDLESDSDAVSDTFFGEFNDNPDKEQSLNQPQNVEAASLDPFNIYPLLDRKNIGTSDSVSDKSIPFPPGFTPPEDYTKPDDQVSKDKSPGSSQRRSESSVPELLMNSTRTLTTAFQLINILVFTLVLNEKGLKKGGSLLDVLDGMVKVGQAMGYDMGGCLGSKAKKDWTRELVGKHKVNFLSLQETKMEIFRLWELSFKLGNSNFDYNIYNANGNSGGILCIWDPNTFLKDHHIISDNFVVIADHHLSDHRPILLREVFVDYGATPFRFYHSWINISVMVDGDWIDDPNHVKSEFCSHFASKFQRPGDSRSRINFPFPNQLNSEQATSLETPISIDEIKSAVWACGSLYKVVTKILAIRLGSVIDNLISEVQSAFLPKRQILDGPFVINEVLSWCKHKRRQAMIFKVDFAKAYDSVRWDFLDDVLLSFGFGQKWRDWILGSLSSGKASVLVNGSPTSEFQFHCGLKQDSLGCFSGHETSFQLSNLVSPEGGNMAIIKAWDVIIGGKTEVSSFLSVRSILLSNGVGFTLLKSAYGASPILFYFGLNRALLFKWVWRFISQDGSLWARVISAIHGSNIQEHQGVDLDYYPIVQMLIAVVLGLKYSEKVPLSTI